MRYLLFCFSYALLLSCAGCDGTQVRPGPLNHKKTSLVPMQGLFTGEKGFLEIEIKRPSSYKPAEVSAPEKKADTP